MKTKQIIVGCVALMLVFAVSWAFLWSMQLSHNVQQVSSIPPSNPNQIRAALKVNPNDPVALRSMAAYLMFQHNYPGAIQYQRQSLQNDPTNRYTKIDLASYLVHEHKDSEALPLLTELAKQNDDIGQNASSYLAKIKARQQK
ncbi:MAG: hypothetical protein ABIY70_08495 [Capsulimonas sp.]|uniref:tetratricopeptide repeat protein n=1 Tax=Capsulimonas sp. TaxID=2494211 RepID=UPI003263FD55